MRAYPHYRDSGIEWLGAVPEHWEVKPLGSRRRVPHEQRGQEDRGRRAAGQACNYTDVYYATAFELSKATS